MFFKKSILVPVSPAYGLPANFRIEKKIRIGFGEWVFGAIPRLLAMMLLTGGVLADTHAVANGFS